MEGFLEISVSGDIQPSQAQEERSQKISETLHKNMEGKKSICKETDDLGKMLTSVHKSANMQQNFTPNALTEIMKKYEATLAKAREEYKQCQQLNQDIKRAEKKTEAVRKTYKSCEKEVNKLTQCKDRVVKVLYDKETIQDEIIDTCGRGSSARHKLNKLFDQYKPSRGEHNRKPETSQPSRKYGLPPRFMPSSICLAPPDFSIENLLKTPPHWKKTPVLIKLEKLEQTSESNTTTKINENKKKGPVDSRSYFPDILPLASSFSHDQPHCSQSCYSQAELKLNMTKKPLPQLPLSQQQGSINKPLGKFQQLVTKGKWLVPAVVSVIMEEIESREKPPNLYRHVKCGNEAMRVLKEMMEVKEKMRMSQYDTHQLSECLVSYYKNLEEPIIPHHYLGKLRNLVGMENCQDKENKFFQVLSSLNTAATATLCQLVCHLQSVLDAGIKENDLAQTFGPHVMRYSPSDAENKLIKKTDIIKIMSAIISLPYEIWEKLVSKAMAPYFNSPLPGNIKKGLQLRSAENKKTFKREFT